MEDDEASETTPWLDTVEGEIVFFRASMRARPVGIHRFFHVVCIMDQIRRQTGREVDGDDIWEKFRSMYDLDALEGLVSLSTSLIMRNLDEID
ncbi:hypothetical protein SISSUDRAFT_1054941 [Sistotremastrum suecicum HHB10207 ss-3]|uniref:Uncharacterized protein n=1 Tax=Sistotremastrum suecicum HHB10207 ss-3 TaxID=1314776 RepID=A0A165Y566_9AGAM|nr:hypothetical protein SISSUDRAFT_1054941 [Sistotremastrum suecicum HHB10207 ss-3]